MKYIKFFSLVELIYFILRVQVVRGKLEELSQESNYSNISNQYSSSNNFVPSVTPLKTHLSNRNNLNSIRETNLKTSYTTPKTELNPISKESKLVFQNSHESFSPSTLNSFYRTIDQIPPGKNKLRLKQDNSDNYGSPSPGVYNHQVISNQVASLMTQPSISDTEYNTPLIFATGSNLQVSNPLDNPNIYGQQLAESSSNNGRTQIENNFYVNGLENQQMVPQELQGQDLAMGIPNNQLQYRNSLSPLLLSQQQNLNSLQNYYTQDNGFSTPFGANQQAQSQIQHQYGRHSDSAHSLNSVVEPRNKHKKEMLTNAQLVSLINELKDFNRRYADKIGGSKEHPQNQLKDSTKGDGGDNDKLFTEIVNSLDRSQPQTDDENETKANESNDQESAEDSQKDDEQKTADDFNSDDLAKFAKYLLAREGSNTKLLNEVKKNKHPDELDEEEDMKDALLEPSKKQTKSRVKNKKPLISSVKERKQSEIDSRIDRFINEIAEKAKKLNQPKYRQKSSHRKNEEADEYSDKARKRRDYNPAILRESQNLSRNIINHSNVGRGGLNLNYSLTDNQNWNNNSKVQPAKIEFLDRRSLKESTKFGKDRLVNKVLVKPYAQTTNPRSVLEQPHAKQETSLIKSKVNANQWHNEPNKPHAIIMQGLNKTRQAKSKVRSQMTIPINYLVNNALTNEMNEIVKHNSELPLQPSGLEGPVSLKFNVKNINASEGTNSNNEEEGSTNSEPVPAQMEPEKGTEDSLKIQTDVPIQDEYPVSEKVADRLNKLSRNLDQYFNDGFLQEVEFKTQVNHDTKEGAESKPRKFILDSKNKQRDDSVINETENKLIAKDSDFDINVSVDGKIDIPDSDNEDTAKEDQEVENEVQKEAKNVKKFGKDRKGPKYERNSKKMKENRKVRSKSPETESKAGLKHLQSNTGIKAKKQSRKVDPVENESIDTPIGPDEDELPPRRESAIGVKGSKESQTNYGKNSNSKFFQEPD